MPNRLAGETSPYLLQHADNPVDWHPWNADALALAREQDRPILLSIGYSACHWCHAMAHESFEDESTAALMNARFVNIKVDREERPDIDRIYQTAHQLMMQRGGGWPLTVVLDPRSHAPFFAGTYFPPEPRHGMPPFRQVLQHVADWYSSNRHQLDEQGSRLRQVFQQLEPTGDGALPEASVLEQALLQLRENFDDRFGGFSDAPKFPHSPQLELLLQLSMGSPPSPLPSPSNEGEGDKSLTSSPSRDRQGELPLSSPLRSREGEGDLPLPPPPSRERDGVRVGEKEMALFTLRRMCEGGLFDHLGGGFCRYSVDAQWMIPHFEKMLYDNGPLLALCSVASRIDPDAVFAHTAHLTADWVLREMQSPEGGFYSSLDADSEGHEGKYYVWAREEVKAALPATDYPLFARRFGLDRAANFEGQWHLHGYETAETAAVAAGMAPDTAWSRMEECRKTLFDLREQRVRPGRDDKILTSWNALMIGGLAAAARHLGREDCLRAAQRAVEFIRRTLWRDGRLLATCKDGRAHLPAYLDDYVLLLDALLDLLQVEWRSEDLVFAQQLADALLTHFEDRERGGFFFTAHDHEPLLARMKPMADEALPSGNGVAARGLNRLGWLLAEPRYLDAAERVLKLAGHAMRSHPLAYPTLLMALRESLQPPEVLILRGTPGKLAEWQRVLSHDHGRLVYAIPSTAIGLPDVLAAKSPQGECVAYRCRGMSCSAPVTNIEVLADDLV